MDASAVRSCRPAPTSTGFDRVDATTSTCRSPATSSVPGVAAPCTTRTSSTTTTAPGRCSSTAVATASTGHGPGRRSASSAARCTSRPTTPPCRRVRRDGRRRGHLPLERRQLVHPGGDASATASRSTANVDGLVRVDADRTSTCRSATPTPTVPGVGAVQDEDVVQRQRRHVVRLLRRHRPRPAPRQTSTWMPSMSRNDRHLHGRRKGPGDPMSRRTCQTRPTGQPSVPAAAGGAVLPPGRRSRVAASPWTGKVLLPEPSPRTRRRARRTSTWGHRRLDLPAAHARPSRRSTPTSLAPAPPHDVHLRVPQRHRH